MAGEFAGRFWQISLQDEIVSGEGAGKTVAGRYVHVAKLRKFQVGMVEDPEGVRPFPDGGNLPIMGLELDQ